MHVFGRVHTCSEQVAQTCSCRRVSALRRRPNTYTSARGVDYVDVFGGPKHVCQARSGPFPETVVGRDIALFGPIDATFDLVFRRLTAGANRANGLTTRCETNDSAGLGFVWSQTVRHGGEIHVHPRWSPWP